MEIANLVANLENMKNLKTISLSVISVLMVMTAFAAYPQKKGNVAKKSSPKTVVVNTTDICPDVIGFAGPTPVEITVTDGKITSVKPLPNDETPGYFRKLTTSNFFKNWDGLTLKQAVDKKVDAISGATYSSRAIIENVRKGASSQLKKK